MYLLEVDDEFNSVHSQDLWVYNKLQLSKRLNYLCGPAGTTVPRPAFYIVRPSINFLGMSRYARIEWIENSTDLYHPSEFWCEIFEGEHLSVDFKHKKSELVVKGIRDIDSPLYKWKKWEKINRKVEFPFILNDLIGNYEYINCEFIGNKLIEVQLRQNPDFRYGNSIAIPVWSTENMSSNSENLTFIEDMDYKRKGFFIN